MVPTQNMYTEGIQHQSDGLTAEIKMIDRRNGQVDRPYTAHSKGHGFVSGIQAPQNNDRWAAGNARTGDEQEMMMSELYIV